MAQWLVNQLADGVPTIVGIDHGFSFPEAYVQAHGLSPDWRAVLADFHQHWPTDVAQVRVDDVRRGAIGQGQQRWGQARWRRLCEIRCGAKSVFHFDVPGSVAKSTHAGLPWLIYAQRELSERVHWWPFDGWQPAPGRSVIAEAYPSLCHDHYPRADRTPDQHDAYSLAMWLKDTDQRDELAAHFSPALSSAQQTVAALEGWILGV